MRKGGYYVNNTLLRASGQVNGWTSKQVNSKERQSNKGTSGRGNKLIAKEDKVTGEQGVSTCNIWGGEKGLKKARD